MSARRLGRLLGSVLALAALVGGIYAIDDDHVFRQEGYDWTLRVGGDQFVDLTGQTAPSGGAH